MGYDDIQKEQCTSQDFCLVVFDFQPEKKKGWYQVRSKAGKVFWIRESPLFRYEPIIDFLKSSLIQFEGDPSKVTKEIGGKSGVFNRSSFEIEGLVTPLKNDETLDIDIFKDCKKDPATFNDLKVTGRSLSGWIKGKCEDKSPGICRYPFLEKKTVT